jgi:molybdate transport system permease protein
VYTKVWLERADLWRQVEPKVVPSNSVRAALAAVESANADAGIVYKTDAKGHPGVTVVYEVPFADAPAIVYPVAALSKSTHADLARRFVAYLQTNARAHRVRRRWLCRARHRQRAMTGELLGIIQLTVLVALAATLVMLPPGVALAWWLARSRSPLTSIVETLVTLPLVLPPVATGYLLLRLLGRRGLLGGVVDRIGIDVIFTWRALVIAMVVMGLPLVVRAARAGFEQGTRRFEQMAETLGAGPLRVFFTISLPLARRSVLAGALLGFSRALGEFGASVVVAGSIPGETRTLSLAMYGFLETGRDGDAMRLVAVSLVIALAAVWMSNRLVREGA